MNLVTQKFDNSFEIIVINDGSTDGTKKIVLKYIKNYKNVRLINQFNQGVCKARNLGAANSKYGIIINLDSDCYVTKNWLTEIVNGFKNKKTGIVSSFDYYGGTSTGFRKNLFKKVGGYSEEYKFYREDTDLSFKIMQLGYKFKLINRNFEHDSQNVTFKITLKNIAKYSLNRLKVHWNDVLLFKRHGNLKECNSFLHVKHGFFVDWFHDFSIPTGLWTAPEKPVGKLELSSPRGIVFLENKTPIHFIIIVLIGLGYVFALKFSRLLGSIKHGKLLL